MARYTVYDLLTDIKRKVHGALPTEIQSALDEGRRNLLRKVIPVEMERKCYIEDALYDQVEKYAVPEDLKYESVVDIKRLDHYKNLDSIWQPLAQVYRRQIDSKNRKNIFAINYESGVKTMNIYRPKGLHKYDHILINKFDSLTDNGTWNIGGNVVNLRLDELNHVTKKASLAFDINNSGTTGFIENFTMDSVNIDDYLNTGAIFSWLSIPIPQNMVSVKLTMGSNVGDLSTDLYSATVNQPHDNNEFMPAWNLLKYMLNSLSSVGNPNPKDIKYIRLDFTTTGTGIPNCNVDNMMARKGHVYEMVYNSSYCLIDAVTRAWKKKTTKNSDQFPFEEESYQLIMLETALVVQKDIYANSAGAKSDVTDIEDELKAAYIEYKKSHKKEFIEPEQYTNLMGRMSYGYENRGGRHYHRDKDWFEHQEEDAGNTL